MKKIAMIISLSLLAASTVACSAGDMGDVYNGNGCPDGRCNISDGHKCYGEECIIGGNDQCVGDDCDKNEDDKKCTGDECNVPCFGENCSAGHKGDGAEGADVGDGSDSCKGNNCNENCKGGSCNKKDEKPCDGDDCSDGGCVGGACQAENKCENGNCSGDCIGENCKHDDNRCGGGSCNIEVINDLVTLVKSTIGYADSFVSTSLFDNFVVGQNDLSFEIFRASLEQVEDDNIMVSAYSLQNALGMVWGGAAGNTASEMAEVLHFDENSHTALSKLNSLINNSQKIATNADDAIDVRGSSALYYAPGYHWKSSWLDLLASNYGAGVYEIDFYNHFDEARAYINQVVSDDTNGKIPSFLSEEDVSAETVSIITNSFYLKAPWDVFFLTSVGGSKLAFAKADGSISNVDFILASSQRISANATESYKVARVPMLDSRYYMTFILPKAGEFDNIQNALSAEFVEEVNEGLQSYDEVYLTIPKFAFGSSVRMKESLNSLGMVDAFTSAADFSGQTADPNSFYISDVIQKIYIGVNEKGIEASASSADIEMGYAPQDSLSSIDVALDHPFFFYISEAESGALILVGRVMDPNY